MALVCEDLARYGVVLIQPSTAEYFDLLPDIERSVQNRPKGAPPVDPDAISRISEHEPNGSAILVNRADVAIAALAYVWSFPGRGGGVLPHNRTPGTNSSILLPFGVDDRARKFDSYWHTIFPGSKRLLMRDGSQYGDNTDVRPPAADELWHGGFFRSSSGSSNHDLEPLKLTLDGVFFVDGGFAGPNRLGSWEQTVFAAETYLDCAALARDPPTMPSPPPPTVSESGLPDPEPIRQYQRQDVGWRILSMREYQSDESLMTRIAACADSPVPKFHKL